MFKTVVLLALLGTPKPAAVGPDPQKSELMSDDVGKAQAAAAKLGALKRVDVLLDVISMGAPPKVDGAILDALTVCKSEKALDTFLRYADNRNAELRKKALLGLAELSDKKAAARLMEALGDIDSGVRAEAARLVAKRHDKGADEQLLKLLKHGDAGAAAPLGSIANPEMVRKLSEMMGSVSDALLAQTLGETLKRADVADPLRVEIVRTLAKVPGADSTTALVEYVANVKGDRPSKNEAQRVIEQRGGGK